MSKLKLESRMTIKTLVSKGVSHCEIARMLGVTEGAVRYQVKRMQGGSVDGRSLQQSKADSVAAAIDHWRSQNAEGGLNLAALHEWLVREHGYVGSLRSGQRCWQRLSARQYSANARSKVRMALYFRTVPHPSIARQPPSHGAAHEHREHRPPTLLRRSSGGGLQRRQGRLSGRWRPPRFVGAVEGRRGRRAVPTSISNRAKCSSSSPRQRTPPTLSVASSAGKDPGATDRSMRQPLRTVTTPGRVCPTAGSASSRHRKTLRAQGTPIVAPVRPYCDAQRLNAARRIRRILTPSARNQASTDKRCLRSTGKIRPRRASIP